MSAIDPIAELERNIRQLLEQGMSDKRFKEMTDLLEMLKKAIPAPIPEEFWWLHTFNMREFGGPFTSVSEAQTDAEMSYTGMDTVSLKDLDGMIAIVRTVRTMRADVTVEWEETNPCGLHRLARGGWGCLECDLSAASYPDKCQRPKI